MLNGIVSVDAVRTLIGGHGVGLSDLTPGELVKIVIVETFG